MDRRQSVLIVDDMQSNLNVLDRLLEGLDVNIVQASSGAEALAASRKHDFAVAVVDVQMPEMSGYELAAEWRADARTEHLPIIFVTGKFDQAEHVSKGYAAGAVDYLIKPYNPEALISKVKFFLELDRDRHDLLERIAALAGSEAQFRSLVMSLPEIVYRVDPEGCFTFLNSAVSRLGYDPEELIGCHFSEFVAPEGDEEIARAEALPRYAGKQTGLSGAPRLFDERRTGRRSTQRLRVRMRPREAGEESTAAADPLRSQPIPCEVSSTGIYGIPAEGGVLAFMGSVGVIRNIGLESAAAADDPATNPEPAQSP